MVIISIKVNKNPQLIGKLWILNYIKLHRTTFLTILLPFVTVAQEILLSAEIVYLQKANFL